MDYERWKKPISAFSNTNRRHHEPVSHLAQHERQRRRSQQDKTTTLRKQIAHGPRRPLRACLRALMGT